MSAEDSTTASSNAPEDSPNQLDITQTITDTNNNDAFQLGSEKNTSVSSQNKNVSRTNTTTTTTKHRPSFVLDETANSTTNKFASHRGSFFGEQQHQGLGDESDVNVVDTTPFESLVTQYEAASSHLPANLATRFQESVSSGVGAISMLVEQWIATESPGSSSSASSASSASAAAATSSHSSSASSHQQQQQQQQQPSPSRTSTRRGGSVGLSNAAKARLRNLLEQGVSDYTTRLQNICVGEIETLNLASAQAVARGGQLALQLRSTEQELSIAKKEIHRINDNLNEQASRMKMLDNESNLREEQFDILRQQLTSREEMLRETTSTFRKELNRFRGRITDLEAELERKRHSSAPVVASWGFHQSPSPSHHQQQQHVSPSSTVMSGSLRPQNILPPRAGGAGTSPNEPDTRGVLAAAAAMDQLPTPSSPTTTASPSSGQQQQQQLNKQSTEHHFADFSFASPSSQFHGDSDQQQQQHQVAGGESGGSFSISPQRSSVPIFDIPQLVQVASSAGVREALEQQQKSFEKRLFDVKQRMQADKRESLSKLKISQDLTIRTLKRDLEQRTKQVEELKHQMEASA